MYNNEIVLFIEKSLANSVELNFSDLKFYTHLQISCINYITSFLTKLIKKTKANNGSFSLAAELNTPCMNYGINILDLCILCGFASLASKLIANGVASKHAKMLLHSALKNPEIQANQSIITICNMVDNATLLQRQVSVHEESVTRYATGYFVLGATCVAGAIIIHNPITWFGFASIGIPAIFAGINSMQTQDIRLTAQANSHMRDNYKQNLAELEGMLDLAYELHKSIINEIKIRELKELLSQTTSSNSRTIVTVEPQATLIYNFESSSQAANQALEQSKITLAL